MRRICDFFGVEEHEILLPYNQFQRLIQVRPEATPSKVSELPETDHMKQMGKAGNTELDKYQGYYFEYHISMACPSKLLRMLVCIERQGDKVYYKRTERFKESQHERVCHGVYLGMAHFLTDRIFMVDYESLTGHEISQTILFPTFKNRVSRLSGLKLGVSGSGERMPCAARVVYEYLGQSVNIMKALRLCGLYDMDTPEIEDSIKKAVKNNIDPHEMHFRARH
ncbi:transcriptional regulator, Cro/CI family protein [Oceanospirillum sp. MED92]|uniref:Transcriptional regulator, Cro/CI family protein n=2 Tax=Neptuniibacter caesariensis TaxID=207954 RepID=A0A7U8C711_NEPCE|nr:transcriptional regulator, Cro/CI family protein [Oceanospirillum sp. MED92] [Neptuniibacter caesariensis]